MELGLTNRVAFVTGASGGIGRAITTALAREGVHLALFARDVQRCEQLAQELHAQQPELRAIAVRLDLERPETIKLAVQEAVRHLGSVDILVNCAGGAYRGRVNEIPDEAWEPSFRVKPLGLIRMTRETLPYLKQSKQPRVINISGNFGREPRAHTVMGGAINLCTLSVTKALANDFGPFGITVNAIAPGATRTRRWTEMVALTARERGVSLEEAERHLLREVPLGKVVAPEDVGDLAVFLASARAGMINGCAINVDGGSARSI